MDSPDHKEGYSIKIICNGMPVEVKSKKDLLPDDDKTHTERPYNNGQLGAGTQVQAGKSQQPILGALQDAVRKDNEDLMTTDSNQRDFYKETAKSIDSSFENQNIKDNNEPKDLKPQSIETTPNRGAKPQNEPKDLKPKSIETTPNRRANISTPSEGKKATSGVLKGAISSSTGTKIYDNGSGTFVKQDSLPDGSNINKDVNASITNSGSSKTNINQKKSELKMKVSPDAQPPQTKTLDSPSSVDQEPVQLRKRNVMIERNTKSMQSVTSQKSTMSMTDKASVTRDVLQAVFVRLLLFCHSVVCVWRVADVLKNDLYWLLALTNGLLLIETFYTVIWRKGKDPKWICPCFLLYLAGTVPSIWLLKLDQLERTTEVNATNNSSEETQALSSFQGITVPIYLDSDTWLEVLQQILLFILVIGRMLLPLGHLSRDELSQMLFIFIGSGSDVMELFVVFEEDVFKTNTDLRLATLTIWSVSLIQFVFVLTAAKGPKRFRLGTIKDRSKKSNFGVELWGLLISITFMDGPYLALRLYAIIEHKVLSYGILFFTCKNVLMLVLLFYRMFIIVMKIRSEKRHRRRREKQTPPQAHKW